MAAAPILQDRRPVKAAGIVERHECEPVDDRPGFFHVTDTATGSGKVHVANAQQCDCPDFLFRNQRCKHMQAVMRESQLLTAYSVSWDDWAASQRPCCPDCGAELKTAVHWVGGRGYLTFLVCVDHVEHRAVRV